MQPYLTSLSLPPPGFVLFPSTNLQAIIQFALAVQKLGDLNDLVFNASFASLSFTNGQVGDDSRLTPSLSLTLTPASPPSPSPIDR